MLIENQPVFSRAWLAQTPENWRYSRHGQTFLIPAARSRQPFIPARKRNPRGLVCIASRGKVRKLCKEEKSEGNPERTSFLPRFRHVLRRYLPRCVGLSDEVSQWRCRRETRRLRRSSDLTHCLSMPSCTTTKPRPTASAPNCAAWPSPSSRPRPHIIITEKRVVGREASTRLSLLASHNGVCHVVSPLADSISCQKCRERHHFKARSRELSPHAFGALRTA